MNIINSNEPEASFYEEWVHVDTPEGKRSEIYHLKPQRLPSGIGNLTLSPTGKYLSFKVRYYESEQSYFFDVEKNRNIFDGQSINIGSISWSPDESFVAILDFHLGIDGSGTDALFVSEWKNPTKLRRIFDYGPIDANPTSQAEKLEDIVVKDSFVYFTAIKNTRKKVDFRYDVNQGTLQAL